MATVSPKCAYTLHDRLFKEFLQRFLPEFLTLFFPKDAARLDFTTLHFLSQELVVNLPHQTLRITDVVAEVNTLDGEPEILIIHVEIEANHPHEIPQRMFEYYALLRILTKKPVLPFALLLQSGLGGLKWNSYAETVFDHDLVKFEYGQVGLRELKSTDYLATNEPVAATLSALMQPDKFSTAELKLRVLEVLVKSSLTEADKLFLINIVETYLPKDVVFDAREEVMVALESVEQSWMEQLLEEGREEGIDEGMRNLLLLQLTYKFGELPQSVVDQLYGITDRETLSLLSQQVLVANSLDEIALFK
ncbi:MAG: hypothetical protein KDE19_20250 [Caldilineaceae bacterium]|nr:hypothetical protein [Caldilineaceae bacterium]